MREVDATHARRQTSSVTEEVLTFVGREHELGLLQAAADEACGGAGALWFLSGEAGIGKSRLAEEVAAFARTRGMRVLWGRCWEAGGAPAYWPWVQVLRALLRTSEIAEYERHRASLSQILPELGPEEAQGDAGLGAEQARFALMDAIGDTFVGAARRLPLLVIVEDVHVADESTVSLLGFLAPPTSEPLADRPRPTVDTSRRRAEVDCARGSRGSPAAKRWTHPPRARPRR